MKVFSDKKRNWEKIQFAEFRKDLDPKWNVIHDELSDCYYNKEPFRTYGVLTKEQFEKLHALVFWKRDIDFHKENLKKPVEVRIPEEKYNEVRDKDGVLVLKKADFALQKIIELEEEGLIL